MNNNTNGGRLSSFREMKFMNVPIVMYLILAVIIWVSVGFKVMPTNYLSLFAFLISIALPLTWLGNKTPILGKYIGFGALLTIFGPSLLVTCGFINSETQAAIKDLTNNILVPLNIGMLLCGSMLGKLDRNVLLKALVRYIPVIVLSMIFTVAVAFAVGSAVGYSVFDAVIITAFPCFSGGSGGPMTTIPAILRDAGYDADSFIGLMMAALTLSNVEAIVFSGLLGSLGKVFPSWTGNGNLVRSSKQIEAGAEVAKFNGSLESLKSGVLVAAMLFAISNVIAVLLKPIINLNYVVWLILLCLILKIINIVPKDIVDSISWASDFMVGIVLPATMVGVGIGTIDLVGVAEAMNFKFFILVTAVVVAYVVSSMLFGRLFGLYPVESGISVGCCSCNIGGTGDLICCQVSKRLTLYPFASISTRIGGAIALVALGIVLQFIS